MQTSHSVSAIWQDDFDERRLESWAQELRSRLSAPGVSLGTVFLTPHLFDDAPQILDVLRLNAQIPLLIGCSSTSLIANDREMEDTRGLALGLYHIPGAILKGVRFSPRQVEEANGPGYWHHETGIDSGQTNGWLVFADPFHMDAEDWLRGWNEAYAPLPILGGLASGDHTSHRTQIYLNGEVHEDGGVAVSVGGDAALLGVISQGCTPIGEAWTITNADRNFIHEIGNRPAYEVLLETYGNLSAHDKQKTHGNLFVGLVVNEYLEDYHRGDFLIRNLLGADPRSGSIAVGAWPRIGQTIQFQRRDAEAATADLTSLLERARHQLGDGPVYGGVLCCCNGRGQRMFGCENHDASLIQTKFGPVGLVGFFCNGEIGPVGERNFLHGFTASLAFFVPSNRGPVPK
jgi:small ligand-binding sensory domain FIST